MLKQVSVFGENSKGTLQKITSILAEAEINIWGSVTNASAEFGIIRMVGLRSGNGTGEAHRGRLYVPSEQCTRR